MTADKMTNWSDKEVIEASAKGRVAIFGIDAPSRDEKKTPKHCFEHAIIMVPKGQSWANVEAASVYSTAKHLREGGELLYVRQPPVAWPEDLSVVYFYVVVPGFSEWEETTDRRGRVIDHIRDGKSRATSTDPTPTPSRPDAEPTTPCLTVGRITPDELARYLAVFREAGCTQAEIPGVLKAEFRLVSQIRKDVKTMTPGLCSCGHPAVAHGPGGCLVQGPDGKLCDISKCTTLERPS